MQNKFDQLPHEIILKNIFPHLPIDGLINVSLTCHNLRDIALDKNLPHRFFHDPKHLTIKQNYCRDFLVNHLCCRGNLIFAFGKKIHIFEKVNDKTNPVYLGETEYYSDASWHFDYTLDTIGILSSRFIPIRQLHANTLNFVCHKLNPLQGGKYYFKGTLSNFAHPQKWKSDFEVLNLPKDTSAVTLSDLLIFYGKNSGEIKIVNTRLKTETLGILKGHFSPIVAMIASEKKLYSICSDRIIVWDINAQTPERILENHFSITHDLSLSIEAENLLISSNKNGRICSIEMMDLNSGEIKLRFVPPTTWTSCCLDKDNLLFTLENCKSLISIRLSSLLTYKDHLLPLSEKINVTHVNSFNFS